MSPDVTVITVFHNRSDAVDASMQSLLAQDHPGLRIVAVDDGSTDDTLARLRRFQSARVEVVAQANRGFTNTLVSTCARVDTEFIALHGAGDISLPTRISRQRALFQRFPDLVAVGCAVENVDAATGRSRRQPARPPTRGPVRSGFGITHGELMMRRDAYERAGGYRSAFPVGQASDLFRRLSLLGGFGYVEEVLYQRSLRADGVNADPVKLVHRDALSLISTSLYDAMSEAAADRPDALDRLGALHLLLCEPDPRLAAGLSRCALKLLENGDLAGARRLAWRSLMLGRSLQGVFAASLVTVLGAAPQSLRALVVGAVSRRRRTVRPGTVERRAGEAQAVSR